MAEIAADQRKTHVLGLDARDRLIFKNGVHQEELPVRAGARGNDAVLAAGDAQVGGLVADVFQRGQRRAQLEVHVAQIAVLGDMETHADRTGVALADFKIYVAHRAVEVQFAGVNDRAIRFPALGKVDHVFAVAEGIAASGFLEAGGVRRQHKDRAVLAITKHARARCDIQGLGEAITPFGDQHDAAATPVHGLLEGIRVIGNAVAVGAERFLGEVHSARIVRSLRKD